MTKRLTDTEVKQKICDLLQNTTYYQSKDSTKPPRHRSVLLGYITKKCHISRGRADRLTDELYEERLINIVSRNGWTTNYRWMSDKEREEIKEQEKIQTYWQSVRDKAKNLDIKTDLTRGICLDPSELDHLLDVYSNYLKTNVKL